MSHTKSESHSLISVLPFLVFPPLFWAGNAAVGRAVRDDINPFALSFGRWVIALVVLLPFVLHIMRRDWSLYKQHWGKIIGSALVGVGAFNTLVYTGLHSTTTTNTILLNSCIPALIMIFGAIFYKQKLHLIQVIGLLISLTGVMIVVLRGDWESFLSLAFNPGDIIVFSAMICWALYTLWMKEIPATIDRKGLTGIQIAIAVIALAPFFVWETMQPETPFSLNTNAMLGLAYVGIFPSVIAYLLYTIGVQKVGPVRAGLSIHLMPVFGVLLSVFVLGETMHLYHIVGIVCIALGLILSNRN